VAHHDFDLSEVLEQLQSDESGDLVRQMVTFLYQALIDAEATELIQAARHERTMARTTQRNGSRPRLLTTKAGDVGLKIPKLRKGSFFPSVLERRRRIDQALYAVVMGPTFTASPRARSTTSSRRWEWTRGSPSPRSRGSVRNSTRR
jgi:hypothetical protein